MGMTTTKYSMVLCEASRYKEVWVIYLTGGSYITDEFITLPGGSKKQKEHAQKVLDALNADASILM